MDEQPPSREAPAQGYVEITARRENIGQAKRSEAVAEAQRLQMEVGADARMLEVELAAWRLRLKRQEEARDFARARNRAMAEEAAALTEEAAKVRRTVTERVGSLAELQVACSPPKLAQQRCVRPGLLRGASAGLRRQCALESRWAEEELEELREEARRATAALDFEADSREKEIAIFARRNSELQSELAHLVDSHRDEEERLEDEESRLYLAKEECATRRRQEQEGERAAFTARLEAVHAAAADALAATTHFRRLRREAERRLCEAEFCRDEARAEITEAHPFLTPRSLVPPRPATSVRSALGRSHGADRRAAAVSLDEPQSV